MEAANNTEERKYCYYHHTFKCIVWCEFQKVVSVEQPDLVRGCLRHH
jgi:hypothetical protein